MTVVCIELEPARLDHTRHDGVWTVVPFRRTFIYPEDGDGFEEALIAAGCSQRSEDEYSTVYEAQSPDLDTPVYAHLLDMLDGTPYRALMPPLPDGDEWASADVTITLYWD